MRSRLLWGVSVCIMFRDSGREKEKTERERVREKEKIEKAERGGKRRNDGEW